MSQHTTGKRQHIVPQQMIRNFAGDDGKLVELIKPTLEIATRRRSPKGILFSHDLYRDSVSDFDTQLLTPVESKFAPVYPRILKSAALNGREGAAFIDWIAAMLVRTKLITHLMPTVMQGLPDSVAAVFSEGKKLLDNLARSNWFAMYQDLLTRRGWTWKFRRFTRPSLTLSDHPVGITSVHQDGGQMVIAPMSSTVVLIGGVRDAIERMRDATPMHFNFFSTAYAHRSVFAGDREMLEMVMASLSDMSPFPAESVIAARKPLFGAPERIRERTKRSPMPEGFDFNGSLRDHIESFGPHVWNCEK
jgi:hypothetical protein